MDHWAVRQEEGTSVRPISLEKAKGNELSKGSSGKKGRKFSCKNLKCADHSVVR